MMQFQKVNRFLFMTGVLLLNLVMLGCEKSQSTSVPEESPPVKENTKTNSHMDSSAVPALNGFLSEVGGQVSWTPSQTAVSKTFAIKVHNENEIVDEYEVSENFIVWDTAAWLKVNNHLAISVYSSNENETQLIARSDFTVTPKPKSQSLLLLSPSGGEKINLADTWNIRWWGDTFEVESVVLQISSDGGQSFDNLLDVEISNLDPNWGNVIVPPDHLTQDGKNFMVSVISYLDNNTYSRSTQTFEGCFGPC